MKKALYLGMMLFMTVSSCTTVSPPDPVEEELLEPYDFYETNLQEDEVVDTFVSHSNEAGDTVITPLRRIRKYKQPHARTGSD